MIRELNNPDINIEQAVQILERGFPSSEELTHFPFGCLLADIYDRMDDEGKEFREHTCQVLRNMNILLSNDPGRLIKDLHQSQKKEMLAVKSAIGDLFNSFDDNAKLLFRLAALYHDIGKYIIKERHPTVGWYTMEYLDQAHRDALRKLLGQREDYLQLLLIMIRDHDEFGVLSTGEASYPILLRPVNSLGDDKFDQKRIISAIMWLNLADMAGTRGLVLTADDLRKVLDDWQWFMQAVDLCSKRKQSLNRYVIHEASNEKKAIIRICRLLLESSRDCPERLREFRKPIVPGKIRRQGGVIPIEHMNVFQLVRKQLETVYATSIPRQEFVTQFTHICKLDYGKRFFSSLVKYYEDLAVNQPGPQSQAPKPQDQKSNRVETSDLIYAVLAILRRITGTFDSMEHIEDGTGNLIGVEMKDLTPKNAPEKTIQIIELLRKSHYPGLTWMMSDCLAWYF
jgi:hypothetical protein